MVSEFFILETPMSNQKTVSGKILEELAGVDNLLFVGVAQESIKPSKFFLDSSCFLEGLEFSFFNKKIGIFQELGGAYCLVVNGKRLHGSFQGHELITVVQGVIHKELPFNCEQPSWVFHQILDGLGGVENLTAIGIDANSIKPVSKRLSKDDGFLIHGLEFVFNGKTLSCFLEHSRRYTILYNGEMVSDTFPKWICLEVSDLLDVQFPFSIKEEMVDNGETVIYQYIKEPNPNYKAS